MGIKQPNFKNNIKGNIIKCHLYFLSRRLWENESLLQIIFCFSFRNVLLTITLESKMRISKNRRQKNWKKNIVISINDNKNIDYIL